MFRKFITGLAAVSLLAVGMIASVQQANALPGCYKTGPNTVQCTR